MTRTTTKLVLEIDVSFNDYGTPGKNKRAERAIVRWIKDSIRDYIPLCVDYDETGAAIEDASDSPKIKVLKVVTKTK